MIRALVRPGLLMLGLGLMQAPLVQAQAQQAGFSARARVDAAGSRISVQGDQLDIRLALTHPVAWRLRYLAAPPRLVMDFREVDFAGLDLGRLASGGGAQVGDLRAGPIADGWSRMVIELDRLRLTGTSEMRTDQSQGTGAVIALRLRPATPEEFAIEVARPDPASWALPRAVDLAPTRRNRQGRPLVVVLDPGHGGIDPGAERDGAAEADLMLTFAREMKEAIVRAGVGQVVLTRERDVFVPLESRVAIAHKVQGDIFISLHADAVAEGIATGATIYTLAAEASDAASAALAERHERDALMSGVDLTGQDDLIAGVLMDMARTETAPRAARLSEALVGAIRDAGLPLHRNPARGAAFSVLKAPDIPSILIEVAYMSSPRDLARLRDARWREKMIGALIRGIDAWAVQDEAASSLLRQ